MIKKFILGLAFLLVCSSAWAWDVTSACVGQWSLNDNAANSTVATGCGAITGTLKANETSINTSTITTTGQVNAAFSFNGATNERNVQLSDLLNYAYNAAFSVEAWINTTAAGENNIISNYNNANQGGWIFQTNGDDVCFLFIYNAGGGNWVYECTNGAGVNDGSWWHVFVTYSGGGNDAAVKWYTSKTSTIAENTTVTSNGTSITSNPTTEYKACIGTRCSDTGAKAQEFTGSIDEVVLYNRVLTLDEVQGRHNGGSGTESLSGGTGAGSVIIINN